MNAAAAANRPPPSPDHVARVLSEPIQKLIAKRLKRAGIPEGDREDFTQNVTMALLYMANPPTDGVGCSKAAHDITGKKVNGARRQAFKRGRYNAGPTDRADDHATDEAREQATGERAQRLATVREGLTDGSLSARDAEMLALKGEGKTDAEIGRALNLSQQTVSNRVASARKKMRDKWSKRVAAGMVALMVVVLCIFAIKRRNDEAHNRVPPTPAPTVPHLEPEIPVTLNGPAELRRTAQKACDDQAWDLCANQLDQAAKLDPGGDLDPAVRTLRHAIEDRPRVGGSVGAKPGLHR